MTQGSRSQRNLNIRQQKAIDLLARGRTDAEVARRLGVTQTTVTEWRLYDPDFAAELNSKRHEVGA